MSDSAAMTTLANYAAMKAIFLMPMLGTWPPSYMITPPYVCSYFVWTWNTATVRSATTTFQFLTKFVPNMDSWVSAGTLTNLRDADFGVRGLDWQLTLPQTCKF
jgi:hypothetical protein